MNKVFSAAAYRQNIEKTAQAKKSASAEQVVLPSGAVFALCRPEINAYVVSGRLPESLLRAGLAAWEKQGVVSPNEAAETLDKREVVSSLVFMREIVRETCIVPRLVENPETDQEIAPSELSLEDFNFIFEYAMKGGEASSRGLQTFRRKRT